MDCPIKSGRDGDVAQRGTSGRLTTRRALGRNRAKAAEEVRLTGKARSHNEEGERRHEGAQRGVLVELLEHEPEDSRRGGRRESRRPTGDVVSFNFKLIERKLILDCQHISTIAPPSSDIIVRNALKVPAKSERN